MSAVLITYDLNTPGKKYDDLYDKIKAIGAWWHYLDSTWIVATTLTPSQVMDRLKPTIDSNDAVLVIDITSDIYSGWLTKDAWDWLAKHV
jgi:hypothetical protein